MPFAEGAALPVLRSLRLPPGVIDEANRRSQALEQYVKAVLDGEQPADIPPNLLPDSLEAELQDLTWFVQKPSEINAASQWVVREGGTPDFQAYPDLNATYLLPPHFLPPFGSTVLVEGDFPHARFFNLQFTPGFQPEQIHNGGTYGVGENTIVDADIEPLAGSTNPYRVGADRTVATRAYRVALNSVVGNSAVLDPAFRPGYRGPGNVRTTSGFVFEGPWGDPDYPESNFLVSKV